MFKKKKTDIELIQRFIENKDVMAFGELYDRYSDKVYGRCLSFFHNEEIAKDATQEVFIKVLYQLSTLNQKQYFSTWLYTVTYRYCIDRYRAEKNKIFEDNEQLAVNVVFEEDNTFFDDFYSDILEKGLSQLNQEERTIILMKYHDELSVKDIAGVLDIKESAVKMRLKRSRDRLKQICLSIVQK